jgi:hypothetical protein
VLEPIFHDLRRRVNTVQLDKEASCTAVGGILGRVAPQVTALVQHGGGDDEVRCVEEAPIPLCDSAREIGSGQHAGG